VTPPIKRRLSIATCVRRYEQGEPVASIARAAGVSRQAMWELLRRVGAGRFRRWAVLARVLTLALGTPPPAAVVRHLARGVTPGNERRWLARQSASTRVHYRLAMLVCSAAPRARKEAS